MRNFKLISDREMMSGIKKSTYRKKTSFQVEAETSFETKQQQMRMNYVNCETYHILKSI